MYEITERLLVHYENRHHIQSHSQTSPRQKCRAQNPLCALRARSPNKLVLIASVIISTGQ